jgi:superfamily II DNA/RNA helicase
VPLSCLKDIMSFDLQPNLGNEEQQEQNQEPQGAEQAEPSGFATLGLAPEILRSVTEAGYTEPTDVQLRAIPAAIGGADLLVSSRTGSGKTAAFVLPALQRIIEARRDPAKKRERGQPNGPRVLVLAPTRELAMQVSRACSIYGRNVQGLRVATVVGGVPYAAQLKALRGPLDILIATPGRLIDHMGSGKALMSQVELLILDEADRMLDMGFIDDIHLIAKEMSAERQTVMFSATFDGTVGGLAAQLTHDAQRIRISAPSEQHTQIEQRLHWADNRSHRDAILDQILTGRDVEQAVVFTSTQRDADDLAQRLSQIGHSVDALHGGMPQGRRNRVLGALRTKQLKVLVATDVAARGIDVPTITHVINYGLPMKAEDYVHRIGRTGRAGRSGLAITIAERRDIPMIRRIERFTTHAIPPAVIQGLEPRLAAPAPARPGQYRDDAPQRGFGHRPNNGPRPSFGGNNRGGYGDRPGFGNDRPRFGGGDDRGHGGNFAPRGDAPRGDFRPDAPRGDYRGQRPDARGPQGPFQGGAPREGGDRPAFNRGNDRPAFNREGGDRPAFNRGNDRPAFNREGGDRPVFNREGGDRPAFNREGGDRPAFAKPRGDSPFGGPKRAGPGGPGPRSGPRDPRSRTR